MGQLAFCHAQASPLGGDCNGIVMNGVRYETPAFAGFTASASWGEDDFWDVGLRSTGEAGGFKMLFGAGYSELSDENTTGLSVSFAKDSDVFQVGGYVQHLATGLFLHGAYGFEDNNEPLLRNGRTTVDSDHYYVEGGIRQKWAPFGATILYADYAQYRDQLGPAALALGATSGTFDRYGGGIAQEIDAAAMTVYLKYMRYEGDLSGPTLNAAVTNLEGANFVSFGGIVNF